MELNFKEKLNEDKAKDALHNVCEEIKQLKKDCGANNKDNFNTLVQKTFKKFSNPYKTTNKKAHQRRVIDAISCYAFLQGYLRSIRER